MILILPCQSSTEHHFLCTTTTTIKIKIIIIIEATLGAPAAENAMWVDICIGEEAHQKLHHAAHKDSHGNVHDEKDSHDMGGNVHDEKDSHDTGGNVYEEEEEEVDGNGSYLQALRMQPHGMVITPVFDSLDLLDRKPVGSVMALFSLDIFLVNLLPEGANGFYVVVKTSCGGDFTYRIDGNHVRRPLGWISNSFAFAATPLG